MQSNFDRRRINGPEESYPPVFDNEDEAESSWMPGQPREGRAAESIRPICMTLLCIGFTVQFTNAQILCAETRFKSRAHQPSKWIRIH